MKLMPIVYVTDMERSTAFYQGLVPNGTLVSRSPYWTEFNVEGTSLALHYIEDLPKDGLWVELALVASEPLEAIVEQLRLAGVDLDREIQDETFGRSLVVRDPDGLPIQINEHKEES